MNDATPRFNGNDVTPDYYSNNRMPLYMESGLVVMRPESEKTLNLHQMLDDIRLLVDNDFCADMELTAWDAENGKSQFTKNESITMARIIAKVYSIAHCTTCEACQRKYLK